MTDTQQDTREDLIEELGDLCAQAWVDDIYSFELFDRITALANTTSEADRRDAERYRWFRKQPMGLRIATAHHAVAVLDLSIDVSRSAEPANAARTPETRDAATEDGRAG